MPHNQVSPRTLRILEAACYLFALLLWSMAIFIHSNHLVVNGANVTSDQRSFKAFMIVWRSLMGFGGFVAIFLALLLHQLARRKPGKNRP